MEEATENGFHMDIVDSTEDDGVINPGFSEPNGNYYFRDTYIQRLCRRTSSNKEHQMLCVTNITCIST